VTEVQTNSLPRETTHTTTNNKSPLRLMLQLLELEQLLRGLQEAADAELPPVSKEPVEVVVVD
jgi:hypothetical protein